MVLFRKHSDTDKLNEAMKRLPEGSAEAFRYLFSKYKEGVYTFCVKMMGDADAAQDAFQETFIKVFEHRFEFTGNQFKSWVYKIARNTCINLLKRRKETTRYDESYISPVAEKIIDFKLAGEIRKAINSLPDQLKEAFVLREYDDMSYKEMAEILDIDVSLAKVRVHRARLKLQEQLEPIINK